MRHALCGSLAALAPLSGCSVLHPPSPPPPPPAVTVVNMIPFTLSAEINQDSEPFLAVHPGNHDVMAASAFTPNPANFGNAPIFVSEDGGRDWELRTTVPSEVMTSDITHAFAAEGGPDLYAGILKRPGGLLYQALTTPDVLSQTAMSDQGQRPNVDQPFVQAGSFQGQSRVYVGSNDFNQAGGRTATVDVSLNGGAVYQRIGIERRSTFGQDGPSIRPAVARDGTVYAAFFGWRQFNGSLATSDVVVVRDDAGATGANAFRDLVDPSDGLPGRLVVTGRTIPWSNAPTLGGERIGSTLALAVDPGDSDMVYVAWADRVGNGDVYTLHVRRSLDRGETWSGDRRTVRNATCCALAVAENGVVGFLYHRFAGGRWEVHLEHSGDGFTTVRDLLLADTPDQPAPVFLPYLGDYNFLLAVGDEFRGVFSASNIPDRGNFPSGVTYQRRADFATHRLLDAAGNQVAPSIDPYYFAAPALP
jgi:hypothetical protein